MDQKHKYTRKPRTEPLDSSSLSGDREGSALVPALLVAAMLGMLGLSLLSAGADGARVVTTQDDDYRITSAAESAGSLAAEKIWSGYLRAQGGAAGSIVTFRTYVESLGLADSGPGGAPAPGEGTELATSLDLPAAGNAASSLDGIKLKSVRALRRDEGEATQLYLSIHAVTRRGEGHGHKLLAHDVQSVYMVEPSAFEGFDYAILTMNVNCVFCHAKIDNADRVFNHDGSLDGTFAKVKVGTLASLELRSDLRPGIGDYDADSLIAGTLYARGLAYDNHGHPITNWASHSAVSCMFDDQGHIVQDSSGGIMPEHFSPAGNPPGPGENLYLNYPTDYASMPDGKLPTSFPPPIPDDGGIDPATGHPSSAGAGNKQVDPNEFYAASLKAHGSINSGNITVLAAGSAITSDGDWTHATTTSNVTQLSPVTHGNVVLTGTQDHPITISGTVAIQGDVVIQGYVKGEGTIIASGNVYLPGNLQYLDGHQYLQNDEPGHPTGPVTFGIAQDGTPNTLGLASGGNMSIGDYLSPTQGVHPAPSDIVTGSSDGPWNFTLAEIATFNRNEWAHTQPVLPGPGQDHADPSTWTASNPGYLGADYMPRYYEFGPGDAIPIYNLGSNYFDASSSSWMGGAEAAFGWDATQVTMVNPADTSSSILFDQTTHAPKAAVLTVTPKDGWLGDQVYQNALVAWKAEHPVGDPIHIDGLLYTNNAIFGIVNRGDHAQGQLTLNGSLVCADLGLLAPGFQNPGGQGTDANMPGSPFKVGLRLNYDKRTKTMLNVSNPNSVTIKRALISPSMSVL